MPLPSPSADSVALVTGASAGLGVDLARELARRGHAVALVARRADKLQALADELAAEHGVRTQTIACDLGDGEARAALPAQVEGRVDILVNNAGYGSGGRFVELDRESEVAMVRLNCEAVVDLCGRYAPGMVDRRSGAIMNVASTVSFQPVVRQATYSASKVMVRHFSEALHTELKPHGVNVSCLCPGPMRTEFMDVAGVTSAADNSPDFIWETSADMARAGVDGLAANRRIVTLGIANKVGAVAGAYTPHAVLLRAMDRFYPI